MEELIYSKTEEEIEERFKSFIKRLLDAQSYDFIKEKILFSRKTLAATLKKFCEIIIDELACDSCTVHLQMYDSKMMDENFLNEKIYEHLLKISKRFVESIIKPSLDTKLQNVFLVLTEWVKAELGRKISKVNIDLKLNRLINSQLNNQYEHLRDKVTGYLKELIKYRIDLLKNPLTFPYWAYEKGIAAPVAANHNSPWLPIFNQEMNELKYLTLFGGVTKDIFQEHVARVKDTLNIRGTRNFGKLGKADMVVWNNTAWKHVFKNFYGIPLRIHSGGEVIGVLKVENKWTYGQAEEEKIIEDLLKNPPDSDLIKGIREKIDEKLRKTKDLESLNVSLLSLAYLENDLKSPECKKNDDFSKLFFIPYPDYMLGISDKIFEDLSFLEPGEKDFSLLDNLKKSIPENKEDENSKVLFEKKMLLVVVFNYLAMVLPQSNEGEYTEKKEDIKAYISGLEKLKEYDSEYGKLKSLVDIISTHFSSILKKILNSKIDSLIPSGDERAPMQLFTGSLKDERRLWDCLKKDEKSTLLDYLKVEDNFDDLKKKMGKFYDVFRTHIYKKIEYKENGSFSLSEEDRSNLLIEIEKVNPSNNKVKFESIKIENRKELKLPDFHFKVTLTYQKKKVQESESNEKHTFDFYMVILPTRAEIKTGFLAKKKQKYYEEVNEIWLNPKKNNAIKLLDFCKHREKYRNRSRGEFVIFEDLSKEIKVTDLIIDRLAARIQAFTNALPLAEFTTEDTFKLKWAAFEIGKVIEREISYRANRQDDPIPLTAMEFYRIPISDLGFIDDLRKRRHSVKKIGDNIDVYLNNIISQLTISNDVEYTSRIKGYRSSLQRIGERFDGYVRGNIAIWVYLLSLVVCEKELMTKNFKDDEEEKFLKNLEQFRKNIEETMDNDKCSVFQYFSKKDENGEIKPIPFWGDAKFDSPQFLEESELEDYVDSINYLKGLLPLLKNNGNNDLIKREIEAKIEKINRFNKIIFKEKADDRKESSLKELLDVLEDYVNKRYSGDNKKQLCKDRLKFFIKKHKKIIKKVLHRTLMNLENGLEKNWESNKEIRKFRLIEAFNRIRMNLEREGYHTKEFIDIKETDDVIKYFEKKNKMCELLNMLVLRNYSHYIRDSVSLLIQIANLLKNSGNVDAYIKFKNFYRQCRELREFLCMPYQQAQSKGKDRLEKIFSIGKEFDDKQNVWQKIKDFIDKYKTGTVFGKEEKDVLLLNSKAIYKRIRMMNNILHRQIPSSLLDWELGRFDLYGARMNCLFKNQVFLLFELIWNKGDPFFFFEPKAGNLEEYHPFHKEKENDKNKKKVGKEEEIDTNKYRQRWLCLRTNVLTGEYNACQIAALIDPDTPDPGYWEHINRYNLKCVQYVLGKIFNKFECKTANKYIHYSWHRHLISECYRRWFKESADLFQLESEEQDEKDGMTKWYGSFLFAGVISLLMLLARCMVDAKNKEWDNNRHGFHKNALISIQEEIEDPKTEPNLFLNIMTDLAAVIKCGEGYSNDIKKEFMGDKFFSQIPFECNCKGNGRNSQNRNNSKLLFTCNGKKADKCNLYKNALGLIDNITTRIKDKKKIPDDSNNNSSNSENSPGDAGKPPADDVNIDLKIFEKIKTNIESERSFFATLPTDSTIKGYQMPLFFLNADLKDSFGHDNVQNIKKILNDLGEKLAKPEEKIMENFWAFIYRTLKRIRREQKTYLFDMGDKAKNDAGLWLRSKKEVIERIKNYVLLFSGKDIHKDNKHMFLGWNAHDLYYYIRSLIPVEIQVRTELTNTFAVQYHDSIYKVQPPVGTEFAQAMIRDAGESLDKIDKEVGVDYEDYILKYRHTIKEEMEEDKK